MMKPYPCTLVSGTSAARREGSSPFLGMLNSFLWKELFFALMERLLRLRLVQLRNFRSC